MFLFVVQCRPSVGPVDEYMKEQGEGDFADKGMIGGQEGTAGWCQLHGIHQEHCAEYAGQNIPRISLWSAT